MVVATTASLLFAAALQQQAPTGSAQDWAALLRQDARALHASIAANHPGPVNRLDPGFTKNNDRALAKALRRAGTVTTYPGYLWAMRGYVAAFDDGHVQFGADRGPPIAVRWPGFLTGFDGRGRQVVMTGQDQLPVPLGAELLTCDGIAAERLAARNIGAFRGRWQLTSQRASHGGRLFLDAGNPFFPRPHRCRFRYGGGTRDVVLSWQDMSDAVFDRHFGATARRATPPVGARVLADGTRWFSLSSFDGNPEGPTAKALVPLIAGMERDEAALRRARAIVLDLRGNGGGSSNWPLQIARILWGRTAVDALPANETAVDWRVSDANLAAMEEYRRQFATSPDTSAEARAWVEQVHAGLRSARLAGQSLWRQSDDAGSKAPALRQASVTALPLSPIFVLTDWGCGSACLDAVDMWVALGGIHVGQETSADTLYMDLRQERLPSGMGSVALPMKVYRGRARRSNQPARPVHLFSGDMRDTAALEQWIAGLPRN